MNKKIFVAVVSIFFQTLILFSGDERLRTDSFDSFSEDIFARQSNMNNFSKGLESSYILWANIVNEIPGGLSKEPEISLDEFLSVLQEAATLLKSRNKIFQSMSYMSWLTSGVSSRIWGSMFEPFKVAKIFTSFDEIHIFGSQHSSVHDLLAECNPEYGQEGTFFQSGSWELQDKYKQKYFVFTQLIGNGLYGLETLYAALKLFIANPDNIFIVQGLNEGNNLLVELSMRYEREVNSQYLQMQEIITQLYTYLPVAFFVGFEKNDTYNWYLISNGGIQAHDSYMKDLFDQAIQEGVAYKPVTHFSQDFTGYQNTQEIILDQTDTEELFQGLDIGQNNFIKGVIFAGRHVRQINNEMLQMLQYGFFSRPGFISLAPTPLSLFGISNKQGYPGIIHRTFLSMIGDYIYLIQHSNIEILTPIKARYAEIMLNKQRTYIAPLDIEYNRIIAKASLEGFEIMPELELQSEMFKQKNSLDSLQEDLGGKILEEPLEKEQIKVIPEEVFLEQDSEAGDQTGLEEAAESLEPEILEKYQEVVANNDLGWQNEVRKHKKLSLWDFLMSIKPQEASLADWIETIRDSYFWTLDRPSSLEGWKIKARTKWRDYLARKKILEKGRKQKRRM